MSRRTVRALEKCYCDEGLRLEGEVWESAHPDPLPAFVVLTDAPVSGSRERAAEAAAVADARRHAAAAQAASSGTVRPQRLSGFGPVTLREVQAGPPAAAPTAGVPMTAAAVERAIRAAGRGMA